MDQKKKVGAERPGIIHLFEEEKIQQLVEINKIQIEQMIQNCKFPLFNLLPRWLCGSQEPMSIRNISKQKNNGIGGKLRSKIVPENHVIAYMFFKYENKKQSVRKSSNCVQPVLEQISDNLICLICQEIYYEGVAVSPCGHVFCGYCLQGWENENNTCPICRVKMRKINKAFQINKIIDVLHEVNPQIEQKRKPDNKYFHQVENYQENESDSDSDRDIEIQELKLLLQNMNLRLRQERNNHQANIISLVDRLIQMSNIEANQQRANIQSNSQPPQINQQRQ